jgi:hypothetical protein
MVNPQYGSKELGSTACELDKNLQPEPMNGEITKFIANLRLTQYLLPKLVISYIETTFFIKVYLKSTLNLHKAYPLFPPGWVE